MSVVVFGVLSGFAGTLAAPFVRLAELRVHLEAELVAVLLVVAVEVFVAVAALVLGLLVVALDVSVVFLLVAEGVQVRLFGSCKKIEMGGGRALSKLQEFPGSSAMHYRK